MWPDEASLDDEGESAGSEGGGECFGEVVSTRGHRGESNAPDWSGGKGERPTLTEGDGGLLGARDEWEMMTPDEQVCSTCSHRLFGRHSIRRVRFCLLVLKWVGVQQNLRFFGC